MKQILILIAFFLFISPSFAQYPNNLNNYTFSYSGFAFHDKDCSYILGIPINCHESDRMRMEVPSWQIAGGWHTYFFSNGSETNTYSDPQNMINSGDANIEGHGPYFAIGPESSKPWKRDYCEIYSAHELQHPTQGLINIGFCHAENKNHCGSQNTINPARPVDCSFGSDNDWDAYYAIPTAAWTPSNASNNWGQQGYNNDIGPFIWPSNGYVNANNESATQGSSHPSSIVVGDYIYIFLYDAGPKYVPLEEGRDRGIKLVRVHINNCLNPSAYEVYYKDPSGNVNWLPSLPPGFTKETMLNYVKVQGPKSTNILPDLIPDNSKCLRFSVAQVAGQNYFIGCEEYLADNDPGSDGIGNHHVALRFSYDLMNWSPRIAIIETAENYGASNLNYPIFLSTNGWTNTEIDLNDFYVIGVHSTSDSGFPNWVTRVHVYQYIPPPPAPVCYDQYGNEIPCQQICYDNMGNVIDCINQVRKATTAPVETVDNSKERAPFVFPNPGPGMYTLKYTLKTSARTQLKVLDLMGREVQADAVVNRTPGTYTETVNISSEARGVYLLELLVNGKKQTFKLIYQ